MRIAIITATFALFSLPASIEDAGAASLSGSPFVIADAADGRVGELRVSGDGGGEFAALYAFRNKAGLGSRRIFAQRFDASGRRKGARIEVFDNVDGSADDQSRPTGWLPLSDGRSLAAFWTPRKEGEPNKAGGHRGQILDRRTLSGESFSIDRSSPAASPVMGYYLERMNGGRALALWLEASRMCDCTSARFVAPDGSLSGRKIELNDGGLQHVSPHLDGFVATFLTFGQDGGTTFAQLYDGDGRKAGGPRVLVEGPGREVFTTTTVGLADGPLLVRSLKDTSAGWTLAVQAFDSAWTAKGKRTTLRKDIVGHLLSEAVALPGGDFVSAVHVMDGADDVALELTRYTSRLKVVGPSLRIPAGEEGASQVLALETGEILVVLQRGENILGQLVRP